MTTVNANRVLVGRGNALPSTAAEDKIKQEALETASAKVAVGSSPITASSASLITSIQKDDAVQASADVLKLSAESFSRVTSSATPVANNLSASASVLTSVNSAVQGDSFSAASAASAAIAKSPTLANSPLGAVVNVAVLGTAAKQGETQEQAVKTSAAKMVDTTATTKERLKAGFDLTSALQGLTNFYRSVGNAGYKLAEFGLTRAVKVAAIAPAALKAQSGVARVAVSPLGKAVGFANKWLPFLNIAGVALSAKAAVQVAQDKQASKTTKVLSIASVGAAVGALVAGFTLKGLPFFGVIAGGLATDIALASARSSDAAGKDTDAKARHWATHPVEAARDLGGWAGEAVPAMAQSIKGKLQAGYGRIKRAYQGL